MQDRYIAPGSNTDLVSMLPNVPGRVHRRHSRGAWIVQWDWTPSGYLFGLHMDAPKPLIQRVDPSDTGLPRGLTMVAENEEYPFRGMHWQHRFGFGVGNRLNGVAVQIVASSSYTIPTAYQLTPGPYRHAPRRPAQRRSGRPRGDRPMATPTATAKRQQAAAARAGSRRRARPAIRAEQAARSAGADRGTT